jgi:type I restriction enzyme M protein
MLTSETRKHIDSARQVLVGKVPDPKSQVNEITNALIYKFMDDMDEMTASVGGKRRYFIGDYEKYSWRKIMDPKVGAHERISLYTEALARLSKNENLPELFRNIFSRAYLPFNDGRTLSLFLQEIDYFDYKNSESLGDAYEYLLSIMGSQGDAGQFRTPRHIIDFIVDVVDPDKNDSVLDPACGTAGFLISAYKHVMAKYDGRDDVTGAPTKSEKKLSADERKKLHDNYFGFDIDDNMVKMAQVNMYLHGFLDPDITVHDTLSSEDYWHDKYDVILANPPFMSPKGGVMPHNKFGVESTRAEVLFVDYITTHLKPHGRAGIIVPEGIIFQSGTAYKQLRKNLVNDGLYAVVSLPSGVFNPYAGVKTSILLFDNELSKKTQEILFVKIENDGFDLGAQRREISKNDLPQAVQEIRAYRQYVITNKTTSAFTERIEKGNNAETLVIHHDKYILVKKTHIAGNGEYNLSGDRYRVATDYSNAKWPMAKLGDVMRLDFGERITKNTKQGTKYPVYGGGGESFRTDEFNRENEYIIARFAMSEQCVRFVAGQFWMMDSGGTFSIKPEYQDRLNKDFVGKILLSRQEDIFMCARGGAQKNLNNDHFYTLTVPLPPLEIQEQIVAELDGYQKIIDGAKQIVSNWKPKIDIDPEWESRTVSEIAKLEYGIGEVAKDSGEYRYIRITDIGENGELKNTDKKYIRETEESKKYLLKRGDVLVARTGATFGKTLYFNEDEKSAFAGFLIRLNFDNDRVLSKFYWCFAQSENYREQAKSLMTGGGQPQFNANAVGKIVLPLPSLEIQKQIVEKIEAERALVESTKKLIDIYQEKTKNVIAKLWEA